MKKKSCVSVEDECRGSVLNHEMKKRRNLYYDKKSNGKLRLLDTYASKIAKICDL